MKTDDLLNKVNTQILALMEEHGTDWAKPWATKIAKGDHYNVVSKKAYTGMNTFITAFTPFSSPIWGTYKQWKEQGAQVMKGEKATHIFYMSPFTPKGELGKPKDQQRKAFVCKCYAIFNAEQTDGYAETADLDFEPPAKAFELAEVEKFVQYTGADIAHGGEAAFYSSHVDRIQMPNLDRFYDTQGYYGTLLHELTHWTGHKSRNDRKLGNRFGSEDYAREELVAEIGSAQLCAMLNVSSEPRADHAKYLNGWKQNIKDDNKAMMRAFSQAGKAVEFLLAAQTAQKAA